MTEKQEKLLLPPIDVLYERAMKRSAEIKKRFTTEDTENEDEVLIVRS